MPNLPAVTLTLPVSIAGPGNYRVTALWTSPNGALRGHADAVLPMRPPTGLAIVVTCAEPLDGFFPTFEYLTDLVVRTFRRRSVPDNPADGMRNRIIYLHPDVGHDLDGDGRSDVDGAPSLASLDGAIKEIVSLLQWSPDRLAQDILHQPLTVYLVGNIDAGNLQLPNGERLSPTQLDAWLDRLSEAVVTAAGGALSHYPVNVVIDAPRSGSFIQPLAGPQRFVVTSTDASGTSYGLSGGSVSFSAYFLSRIASGNYIQPSFAYAQLNILQNPALVGQRPQIEASGNGQPNEIADELRLAAEPLEDRNTTDAPPRLFNALGQITLRGVSAAMLWVYVNDPEHRISSVQAWVVPPEGVFLPARLLDLTASSSTSGRFEGVYTEFIAPGTWSVVYVAQDEAGNMATPMVKSVIVSN